MENKYTEVCFGIHFFFVGVVATRTTHNGLEGWKVLVRRWQITLRRGHSCTRGSGWGSRIDLFRDDMKIDPRGSMMVWGWLVAGARLLRGSLENHAPHLKQAIIHPTSVVWSWFGAALGLVRGCFGVGTWLLWGWWENANENETEISSWLGGSGLLWR